MKSLDKRVGPMDDRAVRFVLLLVLLVGACDEEGRDPDVFDAQMLPPDAFQASCYFNGRTMQPGVTWRDACNTCMCHGGIAECTLLTCPPANGGELDGCSTTVGCTSGPACGSACCGPNEHCNGWFCVCGHDNLVCGPTQECQAPISACNSQCVAP